MRRLIGASIALVAGAGPGGVAVLLGGIVFIVQGSNFLAALDLVLEAVIGSRDVLGYRLRSPNGAVALGGLVALHNGAL